MDKEHEKWAIFWCDLLSPLIYGEIDKEATNRFLKDLAEKPIRFPDGRIAKPSLSTLRRKLNRYRQDGFEGLGRKKRCDRGKPRNIGSEVMQKAIELKKEQPYRSPSTLNRFLQQMYSTSVPRSTLYRHLKAAGATRIKLGVLQKRSEDDGPGSIPMICGSETLKRDPMWWKKMTLFPPIFRLLSTATAVTLSMRVTTSGKTWIS